MKFILFVLSVFATLPSFAAVEFQSNTPLPVDLQTTIREAFVKACPVETRQNLRFYETKTHVKSTRIDQGMVDTDYSTVFSLVTTDSDGYHPRTVPVVVESQWFALQNGDPRYVRLVYGCGTPMNYTCLSNKTGLASADAHAVLLDVASPRHESVVQAAVACK